MKTASGLYLGTAIKERLAALEMTQQELGGELGLTKGVISSWVIDKIAVPEHRLLALAAALEVMPEWFESRGEQYLHAAAADEPLMVVPDPPPVRGSGLPTLSGYTVGGALFMRRTG